jgi:hypothetical protein
VTNINVTAQNVNVAVGSAVNINWGASANQDGTDYFIHDPVGYPEKLQVVKAGWYHVDWSVMWDNTGSNRVTVEGVWYSGSSAQTEQAYTKATKYSRGSAYGDQQNCSGSFWINLAANDILVLKMYYTDSEQTGAVNTVAGEGFVQITGWPDV